MIGPHGSPSRPVSGTIAVRVKERRPVMERGFHAQVSGGSAVVAQRGDPGRVADMTSQRPWMPMMVATACALIGLAGCGGVPVRVSDAETGAAIAGARIARGIDGQTDAVTGSNGRASLPAAAPDALMAVRADGYRPWFGARAEAMAADGTLAVALAPAWLDAFMDGRPHPRGQIDPDGTPKPCNCPGRGR